MVSATFNFFSACFSATSGYSVGYSPSVFLIILIASSMKVSHFHTLVAFLASDAISNDRACSGASVRLLIMFDQCSMSSSQVSLFCECPASACEHASTNIMDSIARILIWQYLCITKGQMGLWGERSVRVFLVRNVYSDVGCSTESSRMSSAMVLAISDCTCAMSRYTRCRSGSEAYRN